MTKKLGLRREGITNGGTLVHYLAQELRTEKRIVPLMSRVHIVVRGPAPREISLTASILPTSSTPKGGTCVCRDAARSDGSQQQMRKFSLCLHLTRQGIAVE